MSIDKIIGTFKKYSVLALSSLTFACGSCDKDNLSKSPCLNYEICNNSEDDNCNGHKNEGCDEDQDDFCFFENYFYYQKGILPERCAKSYQWCAENDCPEGVFECFSLSYHNDNSLCEKLRLDCDDQDSLIHPDAEEKCNNKDDDCNLLIDDHVIELGQRCGENLGENLELDGVGICKAGIYNSCQMGKLTCYGPVKPKDREYCNGMDDDCNLETNETILTDARLCYKQNGVNLPLDHSSIGVGACMTGIELCIRGRVGGDGICHGASLPQEEECDCLDNDCDGEIDEGFGADKKVILVYGFDTSPSMEPYYNEIRRLSELEEMIFCENYDSVRISTLAIPDANSNQPVPILKGAQRTVSHFAQEFTVDIPHSWGLHLEPNLNAILYQICDLYDQRGVYVNLCERISSLNTFKPNHILNPIRLSPAEIDAKILLVIFSDESSQWYLPNNADPEKFPRFPGEINQEIVAQLAYQLKQQIDFNLVIYTSSSLINSNYLGHENGAALNGGGWGNFKELGFAVRDISTIQEPDTTQNLIINSYCQNGDED